jgi:pimeloyl-ACP methyl ester carboxylesterase
VTQALVFLHALPLDPRMWEPQLAAFAAEPTAAPTLYDLPGETMEEWAAAVLESVDGRLVLIGASMGGYCSLAAARLAPERVAELVLVGSRPEADPPERREAREAQLRTIEEGGAPALWDAMAPHLFAPGVNTAIVERARAIAVEQPPDGLARAVRAIRARRDNRDVLAALGERSLAILGEADTFAPPGEVDAPHKVVVPGAGHLVGLERPDEVTRLLREALGRWS